MPHSKTPGQSNAASDKFNKDQTEGTILFSNSYERSLPTSRLVLIRMIAKGLGASNAPAAKELGKPGEAPVASDSGNSNVGVDPSANKPGEAGIGGPNYGTR
jgi:hypothetical protein